MSTLVDHRISVTVEGRSIRVSPETLVMSRSESVHWENDGPERFEVEFEGDGPFDQRYLTHSDARVPRAPVRRGTFAYTVILESDFPVRLDPVIVVEEP